MKNQNGEEVSNGRVDDNRSVPSSGSGDVDTPGQYGMAFGYDLRDKSYPVYIYAISDSVGDDVEIGGTVSKWDELDEMRYQQKLKERYEREYQDDEFWLQFWKSFFRMFWMAFVMVVILYIILALL